MIANGRAHGGQFAKGNVGGPGRPRRVVETDYLATLSEAVPLDAWQAIVARAVEDAKCGDARARDWLTRYLIGSEPPRLLDLAARETRGRGVDDEILTAAKEQNRLAEVGALFDSLKGNES